MPQTGAVYAVAAWAAIQFADVVVPNLGWPQWVVTAVIIAAGVGFPVVLALSWLLEWGPEGIHRTPEPGEEAAGARGTPVEPASSYGPWAVALGVLAVGISGALIVAALQRGGDATEAAAEPDPPTRFDRRQAAREGLVPPVPPSILSPGFYDSLSDVVNDSVLRELRDAGVEDVDLRELTDMAARIGQAAGRAATGGPVEIHAPEAWRYGAPQPVHPGDTVGVRGVARSDAGVVAVELDGRAVARAPRAVPELPFNAEWVVPEGSGFRQVRLVVRVAEGEPFARDFRVTLIPRDREPDQPGR